MGTFKNEIIALLKIVSPFIFAYGLIILTFVLFFGDFRLLPSVFLFFQILAHIILFILWLKLIAGSEPIQKKEKQPGRSSYEEKPVTI